MLTDANLTTLKNFKEDLRSADNVLAKRIILRYQVNKKYNYTDDVKELVYGNAISGDDPIWYDQIIYSNIIQKESKERSAEGAANVERTDKEITVAVNLDNFDDLIAVDAIFVGHTFTAAGLDQSNIDYSNAMPVDGDIYIITSWRKTKYDLDGIAIFELMSDRDTRFGGGQVMSVLNWVLNETPTGAVDGTNKIFNTAYSFIAGGLKLKLNGQEMKLGSDYFESGSNTIIFSDAPNLGYVLTVDYIKIS